SRHSIIPTSSSTWATSARSSAPIARRCSATIRRSSRTRRARRNAPCASRPPRTQGVAQSRTVIVVGGGIGGLTAALALAAKNFRVVVVEQAERLEETGAGIQLSPNATRVLQTLGLAEQLKAAAVAPTALRVRTHRGRDVVQVPLGTFAQNRYGAPYWV